MKRAKRLLFIGAESHYGSGVVEGVHRYCQAHGEWEYHLESDNSEAALIHSRLAVREWKADGIIACIQTPRVERFILKSRLPAVNVTGSYYHSVPSVWTDFPEIGRLAARHFLASGFRHFGFCIRNNEPQSIMKHRGFTEVLEAAGMACSALSEPDTSGARWNWMESRRRRRRWLCKLRKPVAVMCTFDFLSRNVAVDCGHLGFRVPEDVAIVGAQNHERMCMMAKPPLSSVAMPMQNIGYEAARLLDRMIGGDASPKEPQLVGPVRLHVRQSSDVVALEDAEMAAVVRFIRTHALEPITIKEVLQAVPISRRVMEQRFLRLLGRTPKSEITRLRMQHAVHLLATTELSIPAVAEQSGFTGPETFTMSFHREQGMSPTQYRQKNRVSVKAR